MCVSPLGAAAPGGPLALVCALRDADRRPHNGTLNQPPRRRDPGRAPAPGSRVFFLQVSQEEELVAVPINKNLIKLGPLPETQPERQNGAKDRTPGWKVGEGGQSGGQRLTARLCWPSRAAAAAVRPFLEAALWVERVLPTSLRGRAGGSGATGPCWGQGGWGRGSSDPGGQGRP